jgi:hypothetical protein
MRTWRFHPRCPEGKIFDTTGETAPKPPEEPGWVDTPAKLTISVEKATEQMIENAVKAELAAQGPHRSELEREHRKKYGEDPSYRATNEEVARVMDNKTADGQGKINPKFFKRRT